MPTKRLVICYACGYSHTIAGKLHHAYCPKCRTQLKTDDVLIAGEQQTDVLTIGNVTITPEAVLAPGIRITGQKILLDGDARGISMLFATDVLELGSHAQFDLSSLEPMTHLLRVLAGQDVSLVEPLSCTALEIAGTLRGNVTVYQRATIHAGGCFVGAFKGPRLEMEDGAGLIGDVDLSPLYEQTPTKRKTTGGVSGKVIATLAHAFVLGVSTVATWFICIWLRH